jgi:hypothetical protein
MAADQLDVEKLKQGVRLQIEFNRQELERLESLLKVLEAPGNADTLKKAAASHVNGVITARGSAPLDRVERFYVETANGWASVAEIEARAKIPTAEARAVIKRDHKDLFETKQLQKKGPELFRIKPELFHG